MDRLVDAKYVVTGAATVSLQLFCLGLGFECQCGHVRRIPSKRRNGRSISCLVLCLSRLNTSKYNGAPLQANTAVENLSATVKDACSASVLTSTIRSPIVRKHGVTVDA